MMMVADGGIAKSAAIMEAVELFCLLDVSSGIRKR